MFEHVVLRKTEGGTPITAGQLAEAMLYYQKVHVILDQNTLINLARQIGTKELISVLKRSDVSAVYCEEVLGTQTDLVGVTNFHNYVAIQLYAESNGQQLSSTDERLQANLVRSGFERTSASQFTKHFLRLVPVRKYSSDRFVTGGVLKAATEDLRDDHYVKEAVKYILAATEDVPIDFSFDVIESDLGKLVFTNIKFSEINQRRSRLSPPQEPLSVAHLLTGLLEARADLALASHYGGDFVTSSIGSSIIRVRHMELMRRSGLNVDSQRQFEEIVLSEMPRLAEVINSGERTFAEFLKLLDQSSRFKNWLKSIGPDENLVRAYLQDVSSEGWVQRLPGKSLRYVLSSAIGATNPLIGLAAGFTDTFIIEKIFGGWRPNHFISSRLTPFVKSL